MSSVRPPTGKAFKLIMCTVGHGKNGTMDEEYLLWDNQSYMTQLGPGKVRQGHAAPGALG
jgi:hypothetical protein